MSNNENIEKGKKQFLIVSFLFGLSQILLAMFLLSISVSEIEGLVYTTLFFLVFFYLVYKQIRWSRWVLSVLLILWSLILFFAGWEDSDYLLCVAGLPSILAGTYLHSQKIKAFVNNNQKINTGQLDEDLLHPAKDEQMIYHPLAPSLLSRVQSSTIDILVVFSGLFILFTATESLGEIPVYLKIISLVFAISYEPVLTSFSCTVGQKLVGIRVKEHKNQTKSISIVKAFVRFLTKALLGWLSYFTIHSNNEKRAIHDLIVNSVVLKTRPSQEKQ